MKQLIVLLGLGAITSSVFSKDSLWNWSSTTDDFQKYENNKIDYSIDEFFGKIASYLEGCGKVEQTLRDRHTQNLIMHPKLKKIIEHKLKMNEEFTAMVFQIDSKKIYANIVDQKFMDQYCSAELQTQISLYLDGYQIDIESGGHIRRHYLIEKVHLNPNLKLKACLMLKLKYLNNE